MRIFILLSVIFLFISCDPLNKYEEPENIIDDTGSENTDTKSGSDESNGKDEEISDSDDFFYDEEENDLDIGESDFTGVLCTGQDKCYNNNKEIECPLHGDNFYGQDAFYAEKEYCSKKILRLSSDDVEETIVDYNYRLEWQRGIPQEKANWDDAANYCRYLRHKGLSDWRLPSSKELWTIVHYKDDYSPSIDKIAFNDTPPGSFWTSDNFVLQPETSRAVYFTYGGISLMTKESENYVRCVRGPSIPKNSFEKVAVRNDEITLDSSTGLYWSGASETSLTWLSAFEYCNNLNYAGISSWRLPNANELQTLLDSEKLSPASAMSEVKSDKYWTSTTDIFYYPTYAILTNFDNGTIESGYKSDKHQTICVAQTYEETGQRCLEDRGCPVGKSCVGNQCVNPDSFITRWKTNNEGVTNDKQIKIPTVENGSYDFTIHWGDGKSDKITKWNDMALTHYYEEQDTYTVWIEGNFEGWQFCTESSSENLTCGDSEKLLEIIKWNNISLGDTKNQFANSKALRITAEDTPDLSRTRSLRKAFYNCWSLKGETSFKDWNVSTITDMSHVFYEDQFFNGDISGWDVSNVTDMSYMFNGSKYFNADISGWDVSKVTDMNHMLYYAATFNRDLSGWNVSNVTDMNNMFYNAQMFNQDLSDWNVSKVTNMGWMFYFAINFNCDISNWNISNVTNLSWMFYSARSFNQDLSRWNTSNVTYTYKMFSNASSFNGDISSWDTSSLENASFMFEGTKSFNRDISGWNTFNVTEMEGMFKNATAFNQDISEWDISKVIYMQEFFYGATSFDQDLSKWNVSDVYDWSDFLENAELSTANYDALLNGWILFDLTSYEKFNAGNSKYSEAGEAARTKLVEELNWTITDGGKVE